MNGKWRNNVQFPANYFNRRTGLNHFLRNFRKFQNWSHAEWRSGAVRWVIRSGTRRLPWKGKKKNAGKFDIRFFFFTVQAVSVSIWRLKGMSSFGLVCTAFNWMNFTVGRFNDFGDLTRRAAHVAANDWIKCKRLTLICSFYGWETAECPIKKMARKSRVSVWMESTEHVTTIVADRWRENWFKGPIEVAVVEWP